MMLRTDGLHKDVVNILTQCGWYPGRDVSNELKLPDDFQVFPVALDIIKEFGNLSCGEEGPGLSCATSSVTFDASLAEGESDRFSFFSELVGSRLYPLGEGDGGDFFLAISEQGKVYQVMDECWLIADTFPEALYNLFAGIQGDYIATYC